MEPKLRVQGGSYLLLILPGTLDADLRQQLNKASPTLIGNCFTCILTCEDPNTGRIFPRQVVCINLGLQNVKAAELKPHVAMTEDDSKVVCVSCFSKYNHEGWQASCRSYRVAKTTVADKVKQTTGTKTVELWGMKINEQKGMMTCFARVSAEHAILLINSKDPLFFFRPFVSIACPPVPEDGIVIVWANKFDTLSEMITVTNTLKGVQGYVANPQSVGIRVSKEGVAAARAALQHPSVIRMSQAHFVLLLVVFR